uniref:Predicted protein putative n=1 Tax=Albugo laibachii Nc14 TaxID=890382 RepID=F0WV28_9STRA|nr:predicted protein putative [Albugo laibachii Nc14]|eukprot:CCA25265.1 predicted protein putative [Albugo laibachii Nc14]
MKKVECIECLERVGAPYSFDMAVIEFKARVRAHIRAKVEPEFVRTAAEQRHRVFVTPPSHSDLQPIEIPWARMKGNVGRKHTAKTTLDNVVESRDAEFAYLRGDEGQYRADGRTHISAMIDATTAIVKKLAKEEFDSDSAVKESDESSDSTCASDDSCSHSSNEEV